MKINEDMQRILDIAVKLAGTRNYAELLDDVLDDAMQISNCDAGTLYLLKNNRLEFMIVRNNTMQVNQGGNGEPIEGFPPVEMDEKYVAAYSALHKQTINIADVYSDMSFDWQGPRKYDSMTGYHTQSMLVVPLQEHDGDVIGVLQLLNAKDEKGVTIPFDRSCEKVIYSIASETAISVSNMLMIRQLRELLESFVASVTTAIDARTPYNANHTKNVARYCCEFADYLRECHDKKEIGFTLTDNEKDQLVMSAMLHDCGKLITPLEIMNKADRLDFRLPIMEMRWKLIGQIIKNRLLSGQYGREEFDAETEKLEKAKELVRSANTAGFLAPELIERINGLKELRYESDGEVTEFITDEELHEMNTVKGTLSPEERKIIEDHVVYTSKILSEIEFGDNYNNVRFFAGAHHEYLDGTGYPDGLTEKELPVSVRILTIADIYDSLTAADRPYKKAMPKEKAISILESMAEEGKLDKELVILYKKYIETTIRCCQGV